MLRVIFFTVPRGYVIGEEYTLKTTRLLGYIPDNITEWSSVVYFLQGTNGLIKIGLSTKLNRRVHDLMKENANALVLVGIIIGKHTLENSLHKKFKEHRWHGEWFYPADELVEYIKENRDSKVRKALETIEDVGPGERKATVKVMDLDFPVRKEGCGASKLSQPMTLYHASVSNIALQRSLTRLGG